MYSPNAPFILVDSELYLIFPFICFYFTSYLYCGVWPIEDELPHAVYPYVFGIALHLGSTYIGPLMSMETNGQGNVENACINMMWQHALKSCVMIALARSLKFHWVKVDESRWMTMIVDVPPFCVWNRISFVLRNKVETLIHRVLLVRLWIQLPLVTCVKTSNLLRQSTLVIHDYFYT